MQDILVEKFKKYKAEKENYDKQLAIYESKQKDILEELKKSFKSLNLDEIGLALGRELNIDFSVDLENKDNLVLLYRQLNAIKREYEAYISKLMD